MAFSLSSSSSSSNLLPLLASAMGGVVVGVLVAAYWYRRRSTPRSLLKAGRWKGKSPTTGSQKKLMRLYHLRTYRSARVTWLIAELGVESDFDIVSYDPYTASDDDRSWYRGTVHPHGTVPALVLLDDRPGGSTRVALESGAICLYLAERYGRLLPSSGEAVLDYYDWSVYAVTTVDPCLTVLETTLAKPDGNQLFDSDPETKDALSTVDTFTQRLDRHLASRPYICGTEFTAADIIVGYCIMWISVTKGGRIMFDYENVKSYLTRLKARPAFSEAIGTPREWINASTR